MDRIEPGMAINAGEPCADMTVDHFLARVDVGPQIMARHAGRRFDGAHIFSRDTLG